MRVSYDPLKSYKRGKLIEKFKSFIIMLLLLTNFVMSVFLLSSYQHIDVLTRENETVQYLLIENTFVHEKISELSSELSMLTLENLTLAHDNLKLRETVQIATRVGIEPLKYELPPEDSLHNLLDIKGEYLGVWEGTSYNPVEEQCDPWPWMTASGALVVPGYTIAVDPEYWDLGTKFYIEGIGVVKATDTGGKVKGRNRFDFLVFDHSFALNLGRWLTRVWLIE